MASSALPAQYYADDRDIFDLLTASKQKLTEKRLVRLARDRGIMLSGEERDDLVEYLSLLAFDWPALEALRNLTESRERQEKVTSREVDTKAEVVQVEAALQKVKEDRAEKRDEKYEVKKLSEDRLEVRVQYSEFDTSFTRLKQRQDRELTVEISKTATGFHVRRTANKRADDILTKLAAELSTLVPETAPSPSAIELSGIKDPQLRTKFFTTMMQGVPGFSLRDVKNVKVAKLTDGAEQTESPETEEDSKVEEEEMLVAIREILLSGSNVLQTTEYQGLVTAGFYVYEASWVVDELKPEGVRVEYEAGFDDKSAGTGFVYNVKGVYPRTSTGGVAKTRKQARGAERGDYIALLERAAEVALAKVAGEVGHNSPSPGVASEGEGTLAPAPAGKIAPGGAGSASSVKNSAGAAMTTTGPQSGPPTSDGSKGH
jgi:hypothetical protein